MKKKYVIYTAIVGGYDEIHQPLVIDNRFDYVLFSNDIQEKKIGVWQIRAIEYHNDDNTRICRYIKTHPEELLPKYEFSVWIDSNVRILTPFLYERCLDLYNQGSVIASMDHLERNCIYDEAFVILENYLEYESTILDWCHKLRREKYPRNNGLFETNVVFRKNDKIIAKIDKIWWFYISQYSRRDQLSFNFVLWKYSVVCDYILPKTVNTNFSKDFERIPHVKNLTRSINYHGNLPWLVRYMNKVTYSRNKIKNLYDTIYSLPYPIVWSIIFGQIYRFKYLIQSSIANILKHLLK